MFKSIKDEIRFWLEVILIKGFYPRPSIQFMSKHFDNELTGAEIGVFIGKNAKSILKTLNIKKLYLIDPYKEYDNYKNPSNLMSLEEAKEEAGGKLEKYEQVEFIYKKSSEAVNDVLNDLDFVYVDGNHSYEAVKEDIENYYPKIKINGILAGHDSGNEQIIKAFTEFCHKNSLDFNVKFPDWWIVKNANLV